MEQQQTAKRSHTILVLMLYLAVLGWGVVQVLFPTSAGMFYFFALIIATSAAYWAVSDARHRGKPIPHILQLFMLLFWPISVPIYLICTRGLWGLGLSLIHALGLMLTMYLGFFITVFSVFGWDAYAS